MLKPNKSMIRIVFKVSQSHYLMNIVIFVE